MNTPAVAVRGLVKRYGAIEAVRGIDLDVWAGETFGFLGPNGAGKSTTINILCTLVEATSGEATVAGFDVAAQRTQVRRQIGLVFQEPTSTAISPRTRTSGSTASSTASTGRRRCRAARRSCAWSGCGSA